MSEPERPAVEPASIDQALTPDWWETHRRKIYLAFGLVVLAILAGGGFAWMQQEKRLEARSALAGATTPEELQAVAANHEGLPPAAAALIYLAEEQTEAGDFEAALASYTDFLANYPDHPLAAAAMTAQGTLKEMQGNNEEALVIYQQVTTLYPNDYVTPFAMLNQARIDRTLGRTEESQTLLQKIITQYPASGFATEAQAMLDIQIQ